MPSSGVGILFVMKEILKMFLLRADLPSFACKFLRKQTVEPPIAGPIVDLRDMDTSIVLHQ